MKAFTRNMIYYKRLYCTNIGVGVHYNVNTSEIRKVLNTACVKNNQSSVSEGITCFTFTCPCPSMKTPVHVNKITGFFSCPACDRSGPWQIFANYLKKNSKQSKSIPMPDELATTPDLFADQWIEIINNSRPFSELDEDESQRILQLFKLPVFSEAPKLLSEIRISNDDDKLYFPLSDVIGKVRGVRWLRASDNSSGVLPTFNCSGVLFLRTHKRSNIVRESTPIVVSGIKNAVAVVSKKIPGGAICLPYDFSSLPQITLPALEKWNKLILWGSSETDTSQARAIARKLGEKRCLLVRPTEDKPSPLEAVSQGLDLKVVAHSAKPIWHKAITTFSSLKEDVLSELYNIDKIQGIKWKRYPALNRLLRGHRRGELTILTGPTGCGKTTFCSEYSLDLAMQGVNTLWGSFEIRNARLARTMLQQFIGFPLEDNLDKFEAVAEAFQELPIYFLTFHGQQTIKDVMEAVEHATYIHDIAHVIIDNVQFMLGVGDDQTKHLDRFWKQDAVIAAFRTFATRTNCHVTLVMHPRKEKDVDDLSTNSIFGSAKASQEADNVMIIQDKRLTAVRGKKYLQIAKNRYTGELGVMPLIFDKTKLSYAAKSDKSTKKGEDEDEAHQESGNEGESR